MHQLFAPSLTICSYLNIKVRARRSPLLPALEFCPPLSTVNKSELTKSQTTELTCMRSVAMTPEFESGPLPKRRKTNADTVEFASNDSLVFSSNGKGLDRPISPPLSRRSGSAKATTSTSVPRSESSPKPTLTTSSPLAEPSVKDLVINERDENTRMRFVRSPIQLTRIQDLAPHQNVDTVELKDILGDPMIKECWNFNFLFDLDFVMQQFDSDVRDIVKVKIVHGFWKKDDERRIRLTETAKRYPGINLYSAYLPDPFGTHHSKMLILFRHDDCAQIVIHTANMIPRDWGNMTQAMWRSDLLPLSPTTSSPASPDDSPVPTSYAIGTGERFKADLIQYVNAYERRLGSLSAEIAKYDFSSIHAAFVGSAPSRQKLSATNPGEHTSFGWVGLQEILSSIPVSNSNSQDATPHVVIQISSIATSSPSWHLHFQSILSRRKASQPSKAKGALSNSSDFFAKHGSSHLPLSAKPSKPRFDVIFPTPEEIRASLDGYDSGDSIHMKLDSAQQQKQLEFLQPLLCHWNDTVPSASSPSSKEAHRGQAAPHIKTYIRFNDQKHKKIDWVMVTSANLSTQAWGALPNKKDEVWIQSYETGVVVWPALFNKADDQLAQAVMMPVFGKDTPEKCPEQVVQEGEDTSTPRTVVGFRMPYNFPLRSYTAAERPWCATSAYQELDWKGKSWRGYQPH